MAETTVLRSSAINRSASPNATSGKPHAQLSGALPVLQVNMNSGGPQVQGGQGTARQGVTLLPPKGAKRNFTTGGLPNQPAKQGVVILPSKEARAGSLSSGPFTADQLLLCRHLVDKYLSEQRPNAGEQGASTEISDNVRIAEETISGIDALMVSMTAAAAIAAAPAPPRPVTGTRAGQPVAGSTPRRVARPAPPPVAVKMDGGRAVVESAPAQGLIDVEGAEGPAAAAPPPVAVKMDGGRALVEAIDVESIERPAQG